MDAAVDSVTSEELAPADSMEITMEDDLEQEPTIVAGAMEMTSESFVPCNENRRAKEGKTSDGTPTRAMQRKYTHARATDEGKRKKRLASAHRATTQCHANTHAQQIEANAKIVHGKNRSARQKIAPAKNQTWNLKSRELLR